MNAAFNKSSRYPLGLFGGIALIASVESLIQAGHLHFADEVAMTWSTKLDAIDEGRLAANRIALGSSVFLRGLAPEAFDERCESGTSHQAISCYNLGLQGMHPHGYAMMFDRYLAHHPPPSTVLLDATPGPLAYGVADTYVGGYLRTMLTPRELLTFLSVAPDPAASLQWALYRILPSARYRQGLNNYFSQLLLTGKPPRFYYDRNAAFEQSLYRDKGFYAGDDKSISSAYVERFANTVREFRVSSDMQAGFDSIVARCRNQGIRCVIVAPPLPDGLVANTTQTDYFAAYRRWLDQYARMPGVEIVESIALPPEFFFDITHVNPAGAELFSRHVGAHLSPSASPIARNDSADSIRPAFP